MGRALIFAGLVLVAAGILIIFAERLHLRVGRLPGDLVFRSKNGAFYFPLMTCLLISAVLTLLGWLFGGRR